MSTATLDSRINKFASLIQQGIDAWNKAGEILVQMIDEDPEVVEAIANAHPHITKEILARFEKIGRKQVIPDLFLSEAPGIRKLRSLPYSVQKHYADHPVEVLVVNNGKQEMLKVDAKNLTSGQVAQVFTLDGVRDTAQQRAYLLDKATQSSFPKLSESLPYRIKGGEVQFQNCTLNKQQVLEIAARMK
jgi:hypothetical protein